MPNHIRMSWVDVRDPGQEMLNGIGDQMSGIATKEHASAQVTAQTSKGPAAQGAAFFSILVRLSARVVRGLLA